MTVRVGQLWHYPVKSMQGEPTDEVTVEPTTATGGPLANVMMAMASALQSQAGG